jgi:isochorismate hydrolase
MNLGNFGARKMDIFKSKARAILGFSDDQNQFVENMDYNPSQVQDVVTAYKSLKQVM